MHQIQHGGWGGGDEVEIGLTLALPLHFGKIHEMPKGYPIIRSKPRFFSFFQKEKETLIIESLENLNSKRKKKNFAFKKNEKRKKKKEEEDQLYI